MSTQDFWEVATAFDRAPVAEIALDSDRITAIQRGEWNPRQPVAARIEIQPEADLVWGSNFAALLSGRGKAALATAGVTGWGTSQLRLEGPLGIVYGWSILVVRGRCGPIERNRGRVVTDELLGQALEGIFFDLSSWDGADLFMPSDWRSGIWVTNRGRAAFESLALSNTIFTPLSDIRLPLE
jgi:hypothetical protein